MPNPVEWKIANAETALKFLSSETLGSSSIDSKPSGIELESGLSFSGDSEARFSLNIRGGLSIAVLNDGGDVDEDAILGAQHETAANGLPPQLILDGRAYAKYRALAGVKAAASVPIGAFLGLEVGGDASAIFADYRAHPREQLARDAIINDLKSARFVTRVNDVLTLGVGDALAFRFSGELTVAMAVSWSDVFTGQIGTLSSLLGSKVPIALSIKAGASVSVQASVSDEFLIVFSRLTDQQWRVGVRKVKSSRIAPSVDAGISVGLANPGELSGPVQAAFTGFLGAPLEKVKSVLSAASLQSLGPAERKLALALIERVGLKEEFATIEVLRKKIDEVEQRIVGVIEDVVKTRIALSFSYEYSRVSLQTNLLQASLDRSAVSALHGSLIKAHTDELAQAVRDKQPGVGLERYLNEKEITRTQSFGFTLGFGKWAAIGGKDFKKISTVRRVDVQNRIQESYLGARLYTGQWVGETTQWGVDLKADMKGYAAEPRVDDYSFGLHLLWTSEQKDLSGSELEQWLDCGIVWRVLREQDLADIRARIAPALHAAASLSVHVTVPNAALRAALPALAQGSADVFAKSLAIGMPWMNLSPARSSAATRRDAYAPLWALYLKEPHFATDTYAKAAAEHMKKVGRPELVLRETAFLNGPDAFSFAGLTAINGDTRAAWDAFTRGAQVLHTALSNGARNLRTVDKVFSEMDDLWTQSHHVRAVGAYLLEIIERAGVLGNVTRTLTVKSDALPDTLVVTA